MTPDENARFWTANAAHVALPPHLAHDDGLAAWAADRGDTASLLFFQTSGSEGQPKWVGLTREAFLMSARAVNAHLEASAQDRWMIALPLHHVGGFSILARCHADGASFRIFAQRWNAAEFASACEAMAITLTSLVPTQVFDLVQAGIRAPSSLRAIVVGGGALSVPLGRRAQELGWPVLQSYGMTEACSQIATEPLAHLPRGFDLGTLAVLPQWRLEVAENGHLIVKGASLASGFAFQTAGAWQWRRIDPEVGLVTRDRVKLWDIGARRYLSFLGRESSFVKIKGELVSLVAVQAKIDAIAHECGIVEPLVVCALPDARRETSLILVAQSGQLNATALDSIAASHGASCSPAERIIGTRLVEALPFSGPGKINMTALLAMLKGALSLE